MSKELIEAWAALPVCLLLGGLLCLAGGDGGQSAGGLPIYAWGVLLAFAIQWLAFVPAWIGRTEKYYDLTGSLTYLSVVGLGLGLSRDFSPVSLLLAALVAIWALRLGSYLFLRIRAAGEDSRFRELKSHPVRFLMAWTVQGLWVCFSLAAALAAITSGHKQPANALTLIGALVWLAGFALEVAADAQKRRFREQPAHQHAFIHTGLWAWSRHPNYFGEIVLWCGIALIALPQLRGWQYVTLLSPVFVTLLLTRISGIPPLEEKAERQWGGQPDYEAYKARTPVLIPRPPRARPD